MRQASLILFLVLALIGSAQAQDSDLLLDWETPQDTVSGIVALTGRANIPDQQWFFIEAAPYAADEPLWTPVISFQFAPVLDGALGAWDTRSLVDGLYQLRLHAVNSAQESFYYTVAPITVNNTGDLVNTPAPERPATPQMIPAPQIDNRLPVPVGGHVLHFGDAAQVAMHAAGMTWAKWQIPFFPATDLTVARDRINRSHEAGFLVLLSVIGHKDELATGGDAYLDEYAAFLGEVAALGADAIEVWNEMNLDREWPTGQIDPQAYARMLNKAYSAIKAANPDTLVITGALAPTGAEGAFGLDSVWNDDRYYLGMAAAGVAQYADCIGVHYNEGILPPTAQGGDPRGEYPTRYLPLMLERVAFPFQNTDIPMCLTEMGYLSPEDYGPLPLGFEWGAYTSAEEQSDWLAQAILIASNYKKMPVELVIVWNIDFEQYEPDPQAGFAIIRPDGTCPACATIAAMQR